jgi:hypothetical protein
MDKPMNDPYNQNYYNGNYNDGNYNQTTTDANSPGYLLVFLVILIFGGYLCEICRSGSDENDQVTETITRPFNLEKQIITDSLLFSEECVICLEKYEKKDKITTLECNHIFHNECIVGWTKKNKSCPLCRTNLL